MNLIIDVGNTYIKLAVFQKNQLKERWVCERESFLEYHSKVLKSYSDINNVIVSSVGGFTTKQLTEVSKHHFVLELSHEVKLPFKNKYATPTTLGDDRIALVAGAAVQFPKKNVLIIDAGSCITYDFLNTDNEYLGGAISPGVSLRYKALNSFTANLPLLEKEVPNDFIGDSTVNSMHSGVVNGVIQEIDGFISQYIENYKDLTVILTGGDAHFLRDSIKNDIFANSNFLLEGLNHILEHNLI